MIHNITDVHTHYDETMFEKDRDDVLRNMHTQGVTTIINSGSNIPSSQRSIGLAEQYPFVYASVGIFPLESYTAPQDFVEQIETLAHHAKCVAIGEIGLDYHTDDQRELTQSERDCQHTVFIEQLKLAHKLNLPVVIHDREADDDVLALLKDYSVKGMVHRFFSKEQYGKQFLSMGYSLGIGPAITYDNAEHLCRVVREMPLERLLLETDCPFLPSKRCEGQRATSDMIADVCEKIAQIRSDVTAEQVAKIAFENAKSLFGI
jgi:TatD DNase family protein